MQTPAQPAAPDRRRRRTVEPAPSSPPPAREENPGLINEMGKMFEKSLSILPTLKSPGETIDDLNARARDAAKDAGETPVAPGQAVLHGDGARDMPGFGQRRAGLQGRRRQALPDQGFKEGKSLNTDSAETCSAKVLIPGRARKPDDCRTDNYVTRALCQ